MLFQLPRIANVNEHDLTMKKLLLLLTFTFSFAAYAQVNCDGLFNINIDNFTSCPTSHSQINRVANWERATNTTPDFMCFCNDVWDPLWGTCPTFASNWIGGFGYIENSVGNVFVEYIGQCLPQPLLTGETYNVSFDIYQSKGTGDHTINVYGFIGTSCPTSPESTSDALEFQTGWDIIASITETSEPSDTGFTNVGVEFTVANDYAYIAFGEGFLSNPGVTNTYFNYDNFCLFTVPDCSAVVSSQPEDLVLCDDVTNDNVEAFDLTSQDAVVLGTLTATENMVSYYTDAARSNEITGTDLTGYNNTSNPQEIFVRLTNNDETCVDESVSFMLIVNAAPAANQANDLEDCVDISSANFGTFDLTSQNTTILGSQSDTDNTVRYFTDAARTNEITGADLNAFNNTSNPQEIFVSVERTSTQCTNDTTSFMLIVNTDPTADQPSDLEECANGNTTVATFNLTSQSGTILGSQSATNFTVRYYTDAAGSNEITGADLVAFNNTSNPQEIFVNVEDNNTSCISNTISFMLIVNDSPVANQPNDLEACENGNVDVATFDLTTQNSTILGSQSGTENIIRYFTDATRLNEITGGAVSAFNNTSNPQEIFVSVENNNTSCVNEAISFMLIVNASPTINQPIDLEECDNGTADSATFNLSSQNASILGSQATTDYTVRYFTDAAGQNEITGSDVTAFNNTSNPQDIFVSVENNTTQCTSNTAVSFMLIVNDTPVANQPNDLEECGNGNSDVGTFDLTSQSGTILGTQSATNFTVRYFTDAAESNEITGTDLTAFNNTSNPQTIFVSVENNNTSCVNTTVSFELAVITPPIANPTENLEDCVDSTNGTTGTFDLSTQNAVILGSQSTADYVVRYYTDANRTNEITGSDITGFNNTSNPQEIFIRVENSSSICVNDSASFMLIVNTSPEANQSNDLMQCVDSSVTSFGTFDLSSQNSTILGTQSPTDFTIRYYTDADGSNEITGADVTAFTNTTNPQTIFVEVENNTTFCVNDTTSFDLVVNFIPEINIEDQYVICFDADNNIISTSNTAGFSLPIDTQLSDADFTFQWYSGSDVDSNNLITNETGSTYTPTVAGNYTVVATNIATQCSAQSTTLVVGSFPPTSITIEQTSELFTANNVIEVTVNGNGVYEYSLNNGAFQASNIFSNVSGCDNIVVVRDLFGCNQISESINIIDYPLFFTPNGDGFHDVWNINCRLGLPNATISIFDRYGKLLKQFSSNDIGWDGTFIGNSMPTNDYWFTVDYNEPNTNIKKQFSSHFTLKR